MRKKNCEIAQSFVKLLREKIVEKHSNYSTKRHKKRDIFPTKKYRLKTKLRAQ